MKLKLNIFEVRCDPLRGASNLSRATYGKRPTIDINKIHLYNT